MLCSGVKILIFTRKVVHLASFWKWGFLELGSAYCIFAILICKGCIQTFSIYLSHSYFLTYKNEIDVTSSLRTKCCRASSSRKLGREQKKEWQDRREGKEGNASPLTLYIFFFFSRSNFRTITRLEMLAKFKQAICEFPTVYCLIISWRYRAKK